ncbi:hypothetical protein B0H11DRAFT_1355853 [Mycena galericulata]|nr:hypothetical protein B0H11DRAFT_1355853 [Mycena galericulata]
MLRTTPFTTRTTTTTISWRRTSLWASLSSPFATRHTKSPSRSSTTANSATPSPAATPTSSRPRPRRSALKKRPSSQLYDSDSSPSSSSSSSPTSSPPGSELNITFAVLAFTPEERLIDAAPIVKRRQNSLEKIKGCLARTQPSSPPRRQRRVFPMLPPPPDWDEVSLTFESSGDDTGDESDAVKVSPVTRQRRLRFVAPAPPPAPEEEEMPEPTWADFM